MSYMGDRLWVNVDEDGVNRTLIREFRYYSRKSGITITAPAGFVTDFASIPRFLWRIAPPAHGKYLWAAVIHDYLYRTPGANVTRKQADDIFLEAMVTSKVSPWLRNSIYAAVRFWGWTSFVKR